jgi:hypothetical protein
VGYLLLADDGLINETLAKDEALVGPLEAFLDNHTRVSDRTACME